MEIFNIVGDNPVVTPEGLYIPELTKLWKRDKTKNKTKAQSELAVIYHLIDPRSVYAKLSEEERIELVLADYLNGGKVDEAMEEAMGKYKTLITGHVSRYYASLLKIMDAVTFYFGTAKVTGGKDGNIAQINSAMNNAYKTMQSLDQAKKSADKEVETKVSKLKGGAKFGIVIEE